MTKASLSRAHLVRYALARSLFPPTTLARAMRRLGFVQADPIRAPARAQDLILRHRVRNYQAGDLERQYPRLAVEEDFFVNYGFVTRDLHALMHPRTRGAPRGSTERRRSAALLAFIRARNVVHPRDVDAHFSHGSVTNYWGGSSSATTHLLEDMHYRGLLRVTGRQNGIRLYAVRESRPAPGERPTRLARLESHANADQVLDHLIDAAVAVYAPVPAATLAWLVNRLRLAAPQWGAHVRTVLARAKLRLEHARVDGIEYYWPADERVSPFRRATDRGGEPDDSVVRLLAPFDPIVWDRRRFEHFWGWPYRFEAYVPKTKRKLGYYALPMLRGDAVIGWANLSMRDGTLQVDVGFAPTSVSDRRCADGLAAEIARIEQFLK